MLLQMIKKCKCFINSLFSLGTQDIFNVTRVTDDSIPFIMIVLRVTFSLLVIAIVAFHRLTHLLAGSYFCSEQKYNK